MMLASVVDRTAVANGFVPRIHELAALLKVWRRRMRERNELAQLTDRELRDFGASRGEALAESRKPFWRA